MSLEAQDFVRLVVAETEAVKAFVDLLTEEAEVLRANDADALERVTVAKEKVADELEAIGKKRVAFFTGAGVLQNAAAVDNWLATQPPRFAEAWRELMQLAETARELNLANGQCIALLSRNTRARLAAIAGKSDSEGIYTPKGKRAASPFSSPSSTDTGFRIRDSV
ncbi:MAG: flagellar protein FlgN [Zoogloeaceae bacterium]|jgi:flagella synthesis protein FlgN|nr:flagellar protein FlgN [Zoogloeaceae bacterium]